MGWRRRLGRSCSRRCWGGVVEITVERETTNKRKKMGRKASFFCQFWTQFSWCSGHEIHPLIGKKIVPWFNYEGSQLLVQIRHHELSNLIVKGCMSCPL
jgi:hypothetical protein